MWQRIAAARAARRQRAIVLRPWLRWGLGIAAVLVLGVAIGRWTAGGPGRAGAPAAADAAGGADRVIALAYRVAAAQYLTRTEALLTGFRAETRAGEPAAQFTAQARDLLTTTRLMLDSPAARDPRLKSLLEDLRSEEHTSELQSRLHLVCRLLLEKKKKQRPNGRPCLRQANSRPPPRTHPP